MALQIHPASPRSPVDQIDVTASRLGGERLSLAFAVSGALAQVRLPSTDQPERRDGLWRHTCFEAFIRSGRKDAYHEFNFAPSGDWAAYRFASYRSLMITAAVPAPFVALELAGRSLDVAVDIDLSGVPDFGPGEAWQIALSAVIEAEDGTLSYWALHHPSGPPDFHHPDCFVLELAPAGLP